MLVFQIPKEIIMSVDLFFLKYELHSNKGVNTPTENWKQIFIELPFLACLESLIFPFWAIYFTCILPDIKWDTNLEVVIFLLITEQIYCRHQVLLWNPGFCLMKANLAKSAYLKHYSWCHSSWYAYRTIVYFSIYIHCQINSRVCRIIQYQCCVWQVGRCSTGYQRIEVCISGMLGGARKSLTLLEIMAHGALMKW